MHASRLGRQLPGEAPSICCMHRQVDDPPRVDTTVLTKMNARPRIISIIPLTPHGMAGLSARVSLFSLEVEPSGVHPQRRPIIRR
jgi:hypothetical protein